MSRPLWSTVLRSILPLPSKLVALALVDRADSNGQCWPSVTLLAATTNQSESAVRRALRYLEETGCIVTQPRFQNGARLTNLYTVDRKFLDTLPPAVSDRGVVAPVTVGPPSPRLTKIPSMKTPSEDTQFKEVLRTSTNPNLSDFEGAVDVREIDDGPETFDPFAQHPAGKATGPRHKRPVSSWNNSDVAKDFADQATRFYPMVSGRCNLAALAGTLKRDRDRTGNTAEIHVAMIDAFFWDRRHIIEDIPLWKQFIAAMARLQHRAEQTVADDREDRQGRAVGDPVREEKPYDGLAETNKWLVASGFEPVDSLEG